MRKFLEDVGSEEEGEKEEEGKVPERDESLDGIDGKVEALASKEKAEVKRLDVFRKHMVCTRFVIILYLSSDEMFCIRNLGRRIKKNHFEPIIANT